MDNHMKLELAAKSENESFARSAVAAFALPLRPTLSEISDVKTAVSEAVTNCVVHAYGAACKNANIVVECRLERKEQGGVLHISVSDFGCGITNVEQAKMPFFSTSKTGERSGMGFTIMQTFMDECNVESEKGKGTRVILKKRILGETSQEKERVDA